MTHLTLELNQIHSPPHTVWYLMSLHVCNFNLLAIVQIYSVKPDRLLNSVMANFLSTQYPFTMLSSEYNRKKYTYKMILTISTYAYPNYCVLLIRKSICFFKGIMTGLLMVLHLSSILSTTSKVVSTIGTGSEKTLSIKGEYHSREKLHIIERVINAKWQRDLWAVANMTGYKNNT